MQYLNTSNSSIVESLGSLCQSSCSWSKMAFKLEFVDTKDNPGEVIDKVFKITEQTVENYGYKTPCSFTIPVRWYRWMYVRCTQNNNITCACVCLLIKFCEPSWFVNSYRIPALYAVVIQFKIWILAEQSRQTLKINVILIVEYFVNIIQLEYLVVILVNEAYGNSFVESL